MNNNNNLQQGQKSVNPYILLVFAIIIDLIGFASYLIPVIGESIDVIWAPIQAYMLHVMFGSYLISIVGFVEELLPGLDFIPTACIGWYATYVWKQQ